MTSQFIRLPLAVAVILTLAACAAPVTAVNTVDGAERDKEEKVQQVMAFQSSWNMQLRLSDVGYGLLKGAVDQCGETVRPHLGFLARDLTSVTAEPMRPIATQAVGLDDQLRVYSVYRQSAAQAAGLKVGDVIVRSSTEHAPPKETREQAAQRLPLETPVVLEITRAGKPLKITLKPELVCDYPVQFSDSQDVNAYADGKAIYVTRGMARFATQDRELALVIGHELGHNTMKHSDKKTVNASIGLIFDILAASRGINTNNAFSNLGGQTYSQDFEREADYVGLYYLARAGYPIEGAADFWRRMAAEYPSSIKASHSASHPATSERFLAIDKTAVEIAEKVKARAALVPNLAQNKSE